MRSLLKDKQRLVISSYEKMLYIYNVIDSRRVANYFCSLQERELISGCSEKRAVYKIERLGLIVKVNTINRFKRKLMLHFGVQKHFGRFSLIDEYKSLENLSELSFVPRVYAYGVNAKGLAKKEILILELLKNSQQLDEYLTDENKFEAITQVFFIFLKAWESGFVHMDPNPANIMVGQEGFKLIDFECCCLKLPEPEFCFGFSFGYFYHHWMHRYIKEQDYDCLVSGFIESNLPGLQVELFSRYYKVFKDVKVSRRKRFNCFYNSRVRWSLLD